MARTRNAQAGNEAKIKALEGKLAEAQAVAPVQAAIQGVDELIARMDGQDKLLASTLALVEGLMGGRETAVRDVSPASARSQAQQRAIATDDLDEAIAAVPIPTGVSTTSAQRIRRVAKGNQDSQAAYDAKLTGKSPRRDYFEACVAARGSMA